MYVLLLSAATVLLAFVLEVREAPLPESGELSEPKLDHRVFRRRAAVGVAAALAFEIGVITAYLVNPDWTSFIVGWPLNHPSSLLLSGFVLYLGALFCGVKPRQSVLLLCLALPGLVVMPLVLLAGIVLSNNAIAAAIAVPVVFFLQPAAWILLFVGIGQTRLLRKPGGNFTSSGLVRIFLISLAYLYGTLS